MLDSANWGRLQDYSPKSSGWQSLRYRRNKPSLKGVKQANRNPMQSVATLINSLKGWFTVWFTWARNFLPATSWQPLLRMSFATPLDNAELTMHLERGKEILGSSKCFILVRFGVWQSWIGHLKPNSGSEMSDWMSKINDSTPLTALSVPGTHDAAACKWAGLKRKNDMDIHLEP